MTIVYRQLSITPDIAKITEKGSIDIIVTTGMNEGGSLLGNNIGTSSI